MGAIKAEDYRDPLGCLHGADNLDPELAQLMVETGMSYFEIHASVQELVRKMRMNNLDRAGELQDAGRCRLGITCR